ncbi:ricin-type beta-trefoil lectin domain protein [Streptomyces sp900105245]|uniref:RICIN domain-containing protein n=1 Tax=Streptomyces sp. 900105245 TaxID=3154379 RepID=UPI0033236EE2
MKKRFMGRLAVAILTPAVILAGAGQAFANGTVTWKNKLNGKCLGYVNNIPLAAADCGTPPSKWTETKQSDGSWTLKTSYGDCLDSNRDGKVYIRDCNGGANQKWEEIKDTAGWRLKNKATGLTLGQHDGVLYTGFDGGLKAQRWS